MSKVRFEYYSHDLNSREGSVNLYRRVETGGEVYYLAAEVERLVEAAKAALRQVHNQPLMDALAAIEAEP